MKSRACPTIPLALLLLLAACGGERTDQASPAAEPVEPLSVYVGSYPLAYFAERIGGEHVHAELPVPDGADPAGWSPDAETVLAYQGADLILLNGAEYESWTATATLPQSRLVDTSAGFADEIIFVEDAFTHSHGPEGDHSHGETASVTWLDLTLALRQAEAVRNALIAVRPEAEADFRDRFDALAADLRRLDAELTTATRGAAPLLAATPDYSYLARRYNLNVRALRYDAAEPMGRAFWHDLEHTVGFSRTMLWPEPPSAEVAERLARMEIRPVVFNPAGKRPAEGDFVAAMEANVERLREAGGGGS